MDGHAFRLECIFWGGTVPEIYVDIYLMTNFVLNYALLYATAVAANRTTTARKLLQAAAVGTGYSFGYLLPGWNLLYSLPAVVVIAVILVAIAMRPLNLPTDLVLLFPFVGLVLAAGGAGLVLMGASTARKYRSGDVLASRLSFVVGLAALILIIGLGAKYYWNRRVYSGDMMVELTVVIGGKHWRCQGFVDTGNQLVDPLSGSPVIVIEQEAIQDIMGDSWPGEGELSTDSRSYPSEAADLLGVRFKLIPFKSLGDDRGVMIGFRPDQLYIGEHKVDDVVICLARQSLSSTAEYQALVPPILGEIGRGADACG